MDSETLKYNKKLSLNQEKLPFKHGLHCITDICLLFISLLDLYNSWGQCDIIEKNMNLIN